MQKYLLLVCALIFCICKDGYAAEKVMIQSMSRYDGISREEIIKKREEKMIYSSFYRYDYKPKIFDAVKEGEKWPGNKASCSRYKLNDGLSEASIWINNPDILIHMSGASKYFTGVYAGVYNPVFCVYAQQLLFKPLRIYFDSEKKEITSTYRAYNILLGIGSHTFGALDFYLSPINAYDVGFNYYAMVESKGISFDTDRNKNSAVKQLSDVVSTKARLAVCPRCFVREEGSCVCYKNKENQTVQLTSKRAEMLFKLWKEKPLSKDDEADFYYRIKFVE